MSVETLTGRAPIENKGTRQKWDVDGVARFLERHARLGAAPVS